MSARVPAKGLDNGLTASPDHTFPFSFVDSLASKGGDRHCCYRCFESSRGIPLSDSITDATSTISASSSD